MKRISAHAKNHKAGAVSALALLLASGAWGWSASAQPIQIHVKPFACGVGLDEPVVDEPVIQLAICLDTSGSMQGLINQARSRIWSVVRDLDEATYKGQKPRLEVALYQYGSHQHPSDEGFMTCVLPFTSDLDQMSESLYALTIGGSAEYCGQAVERATRELSWLPASDNVMKVLVIAGNETFAQGPVRYQVSVPEAVEYGITINTVHCGTDSEGRRGGWLHAANLGGGVYNIIDHNRDFIEIHCPQDERLRELNAELNSTYIRYGAEGEMRMRRQLSVDRAGARDSEMVLQDRIAAKASSMYTNSHWDLVDAAESDDFDASKVDRATLEPELQKASDEELMAHIRKLADRRAKIQKEIGTLSAERESWLRAEQERRGENVEDGLDYALIAALRSQAMAQGFAFDGE